MKNDRRMREVESLIFSDGSALSLGDCFVSKSIFGFLPPIQLSAPDVEMFSDAGTKLLNYITRIREMATLGICVPLDHMQSPGC